MSESCSGHGEQADPMVAQESSASALVGVERERLAIYRFISQRSLETREQEVLLPLMNDIMNGKHLGGSDE